jgi:hypothetical protein
MQLVVIPVEELMAAVGCWRKKKFVEREREVVHSPRKVFGQRLIVEMVVVKPMVGVVVAEGRNGEREREKRKFTVTVEMGGEADCLLTLDLISSSSRP